MPKSMHCVVTAVPFFLLPCYPSLQFKYRHPNVTMRRAVGVFVGQGAQRVGMAASYCPNPTFRGAVDECAEHYTAHGGAFDIGHAIGDCLDIDDTVRTQPLLCALQIGLAKAMQCQGVSYSHVVGHSLGEVAAAHYAGILTTHEAMGLILHRADALKDILGEMVVVAASAASAREVLLECGLGSVVSVAASNDVGMTSLCGADLSSARAEFKARRIVTRPVPVRYAFHSPLITPGVVDTLKTNLEPVFSRSLDEVREAMAAQPANAAYYPTGLLTEEELCAPDADLVYAAKLKRDVVESVYSPQYWAHQIRHPVSFSSAIRVIAEEASVEDPAANQDTAARVSAFEVSPAPVLARSLARHFDVQPATI